MTPQHRLSAAVLLCLLAAACAAGPPRRGPGPGPGGPPPGGGAPRAALFISPAGEPFRGADGRQAWLRHVDPGATGTITLEALVADARRYFAVLDLDHDGAISGPELWRYENEIAPEILGDTGRGGLQGAARFGLLNDPQPIRSADFDLDYRVTLAEYERKARETYARLDANHDGVLKVAELPPPPSLQGPGRGGARPGAPPRGGGRGPGGGRPGR